MASEIVFNANFQAVKAGAAISLDLKLTEDMAGNNFGNNVVNVATSGAAIDIGSCSAIGWLLVKNLDPVNFIQVDAANNFALFPQKILPGEMIALRPQTTTIYAKADTAQCTAQIIVCEP